MPCLASQSVVVAGPAPALLDFMYWALLTPMVTMLFWALAAPFIQYLLLCMLGKLVCTLHAGIACLVSHLHAEIACLSFLACDWLLLIGAYPLVSVVSLALIGGYLWSVS